MATLIIPSPHQGADIENFTIELDLSDNTEKLVLVITDRYPNVSGGILIPRTFSYNIVNQANSSLLEKTANVYGLRFIDQKNDDGQRKVIYHFNIDIEEFEEDTSPEIFLTQIYTPDANGDNTLIYSFEIQKDDDDEDTPDDDALTEEDVNRLIDEKIQSLIFDDINSRIDTLEARVDTIDETLQSEDNDFTEIKKGKNSKS